MNFFEKIQNLSEGKRKIILWSVVIIIGLPLFILWVKNVQEKLKSFPKGESKIPSLRQELQGLPRIELPEINEEELKKIEEMIKEKSSGEEK